jgi:hypothetical protein
VWTQYSGQFEGLSPYQVLSTALTDYLFTCYTRHIAASLHRKLVGNQVAAARGGSGAPVGTKGKGVWINESNDGADAEDASARRTHGLNYLSMYRFFHVPGKHTDPTNAKASQCTHEVCHAVDNTFVFRSSSFTPGFHFTPEEDSLSNEIMQSWASFMHGRARNSSTWPLYDPATDITTVWEDLGATLQTGIQRQHCEFWEKIGWRF